MALKKKLSLLCLGVLATNFTTNNVSAMMDFEDNNLSYNFYTNKSPSGNLITNDDDKSYNNYDYYYYNDPNANPNFVKINNQTNNDWYAGVNTENSSENYENYSNDESIQLNSLSINDLPDDLEQLLNFENLVEYSHVSMDNVGELKIRISNLVNSIVANDLPDFLISILGNTIRTQNQIPDLVLTILLQSLEINFSNESVNAFYYKLQQNKQNYEQGQKTGVVNPERKIFYRLLSGIKDCNSIDSWNNSDFSALAKLIMHHQDKFVMMLLMNCFIKQASLEANNKLLSVLIKQIQSARKGERTVAKNTLLLVNSLLIKNLFVNDSEISDLTQATSKFIKNFIFLCDNVQNLNLTNDVYSNYFKQCMAKYCIDNCNKLIVNSELEDQDNPELGIVGAMQLYYNHKTDATTDTSVLDNMVNLLTNEDKILTKLVSYIIGNWAVGHDLKGLNSTDYKVYLPIYIQQLLENKPIKFQNVKGLLSLMDQVSNDNRSNQQDLDCISDFKNKILEYSDDLGSNDQLTKAILYFCDKNNRESINNFMRNMRKHGYGVRHVPLSTYDLNKRYNLQFSGTNNSMNNLINLLQHDNTNDNEILINRTHWNSFYLKCTRGDSFNTPNSRLLQILNKVFNKFAANHNTAVHINVQSLMTILCDIVDDIGEFENGQFSLYIKSLLKSHISVCNFQQLKTMLVDVMKDCNQIFTNNKSFISIINRTIQSNVDMYITPSMVDFFCHGVKTYLENKGVSYNSNILKTIFNQIISECRLKYLAELKSAYHLSDVDNNVMSQYEKLMLNDYRSAHVSATSQIIIHLLLDALLQYHVINLGTYNYLCNNSNNIHNYCRDKLNKVIGERSTQYVLLGLLDKQHNNYNATTQLFYMPLYGVTNVFVHISELLLQCVNRDPLLSICNNITYLIPTNSPDTPWFQKMKDINAQYVREMEELGNRTSEDKILDYISGAYDTMLKYINQACKFLPPTMIQESGLKFSNLISKLQQNKQYVISCLYNTVQQHALQLSGNNMKLIKNKITQSLWQMYYCALQIIDRPNKNGSKLLSLSNFDLFRANTYGTILDAWLDGSMQAFSNFINNDNNDYNNILANIIIPILQHKLRMSDNLYQDIDLNLTYQNFSIDQSQVEHSFYSRDISAIPHDPLSRQDDDDWNPYRDSY